MTQLTSDNAARLSPPRQTAGLLLSDYVQLAKPRLTLMVVITSFIGYGMGMHSGVYGASGGAFAGLWSYISIFAVLAGTALTCIGAGALNQVLERDTDAKMHRTMHRPVPAGRISPAHAVAYAAVAAMSGLLMLLVAGGLLCSLVAALCMALYVLVYTPMKKASTLSTIVGAVPGALPPVIGYTAARGELGIEAYLLFVVLFLWQLPHFLAIAWMYRLDYARAGLPLLAVVDPQGHSTFRQIVLGCMVLLPVGLLPTVTGVSGIGYFMAALAAGAIFLGFGIALAFGRTRRHARSVFFASLVYLPVVFTAMLIDKGVTGGAL